LLRGCGESGDKQERRGVETHRGLRVK
jgi:hypothetical protein